MNQRGDQVTTTAPAWHLEAACHGADPELFFPTSTISPEGRAAIAEARQICSGCPVLAACLADVMDHEGGKQIGSRFGIYAALTPTERHSLHRAKTRRDGGQPRVARCGTAPGYRKHLREGVTPCQPCRDANSAVNRETRRRRTLAEREAVA